VRIGIVTEYYAPSVGGVQEHVRHFAREASRLGHSVTVLTGEMRDLRGRGPEPAPDPHDPKVVHVGRSFPIYNNGGVGRVTVGPRVSAAVREALDAGRFDVVHVHAPLTPVLPLLAIHHATVPLVGTFHTNWQPGLVFRAFGAVLRRYLERLDAAVAVSRACISALPFPGNFRIVPNGVDVERFGRGRRLPQFDDGKVNLLWVGRIERRNGLDRMLHALELVRREVDARLIVVGDGPLLATYRARVPATVQDDVVFAGRVIDERPDYYASAHVFCAPTRIASFGVTLIEAMAAGAPIVASDIDGFREVLHHGVEGELVPPDDTEAWASAIVRLAREPARAAAYGAAGLRTVTRYDWRNVAHEVLSVYRSVGVRE
jgi:phosphatidyl-myo-inositol alpha-mannosyltransferase